VQVLAAHAPLAEMVGKLNAFQPDVLALSSGRLGSWPGGTPGEDHFERGPRALGGSHADVTAMGDDDGPCDE
jgi:hypothetical protein